MPHFCHCGMDTCICQICARIGCDTRGCPNFNATVWHAPLGNICVAHTRAEIEKAERARVARRS
jgi:hypothetical protein